MVEGVEGYLSRAFLALLKDASGLVNRKLAVWREQSKIKELYKKIGSVTKVKTIWSVDKDVDVKKFYYPVRVGDSVRPVSHIGALDFNGGLVISGVAGQGKSIFMRYLCSQELRRSEVIPVFVELRYLRKSYNLELLVKHVLEELGFQITDEVYEYLLASGRMVLFLDGFDEVLPEASGELIYSLGRYLKLYERLRVVVSSRPNTQVYFLPGFKVVRIAPLTDFDYLKILQKLCVSEDLAFKLKSGIDASSVDVKGLLTTPLMMTLLVLTYKSTGKMPETQSEFYDALFHTFLIGHDRSKPGFVRHRELLVSEILLRRVFEDFCFFASKESKAVMAVSQAQEYAYKSLELNGLKCDVDGFLHDMTSVASMLLLEGNEYSFVHKSVMEYFSAGCVKSNDNVFAERFYGRMVGLWSGWRQELQFLSSIDRERYLRFFYKDYLCAVLDFYGEFLDGDFVLYDVDDVLGGVNIYFSRGGFLDPVSGGLFSFCYDDVYNVVVESYLRVMSVDSSIWSDYFGEVGGVGFDGRYSISLRECMILNNFAVDRSLHREKVFSVLNRYKSVSEEIRIYDSRKIAMLIDF